jgi:hypothetical protein
MRIPARWRDRIEQKRPQADHSLPSAEPLTPVVGLLPDSPCPHFTYRLDAHGRRLRGDDGRELPPVPSPIRPGSDHVCLVCHSWGHDALLARLGPPPKLVAERRADDGSHPVTTVRFTQSTHDALTKTEDGRKFLARAKVEVIPDPPRARRRQARVAYAR